MMRVLLNFVIALIFTRRVEIFHAIQYISLSPKVINKKLIKMHKRRHKQPWSSAVHADSRLARLKVCECTIIQRHWLLFTREEVLLGQVSDRRWWSRVGGSFLYK